MATMTQVQRTFRVPWEEWDFIASGGDPDITTASYIHDSVVRPILLEANEKKLSIDAIDKHVILTHDLDALYSWHRRWKVTRYYDHPFFTKAIHGHGSKYHILYAEALCKPYTHANAYFIPEILAGNPEFPTTSEKESL